MGINLADITLAALLILALIYGWRRGTINVVAKIGAWVIGYQAARTFSPVIAAYIAKALPSLAAPAAQNAASQSSSDGGQLLKLLSIFVDTSGAVNRLLEIILFIIIFIVVGWLIRKVAYMLTGLFGRGLLGKINRAIGAFIALLLMIAIIIIIQNILLPVFADMVLGRGWLAFWQRSHVIMPFINNIAALFQ